MLWKPKHYPAEAKQEEQKVIDPVPYEVEVEDRPASPSNVELQEKEPSEPHHESENYNSHLRESFAAVEQPPAIKNNTHASYSRSILKTSTAAAFKRQPENLENTDVNVAQNDQVYQ